MKLEELKIEDLRQARRVVLDKEYTTIVGGAGDRKAIDGRCAEIRREIEKNTSDYDREKLRERLAKLAGGVAVIRVGAPSETEMKNRKEALEDAISATTSHTYGIGVTGVGVFTTGKSGGYPSSDSAGLRASLRVSARHDARSRRRQVAIDPSPARIPGGSALVGRTSSTSARPQTLRRSPRE